MLGALAASRDDQRRLVEDAGHELRTPLTSVRTNLAVLRRHPDLDPQTREQVLDDLHAETEELVGLVEEVVALARGVTDGAPAERVELGPLAGAVAARAERRHGRPVTVDGRRLRRRGAAARARAGDLQPRRQRRQVRSERTARSRSSSTDGAVTVLDRGPGIARATSAADLRPLLPRRRCPRPARLGPRAVDRARRGRRQRRRRQRGRPAGRRRQRRLPPATRVGLIRGRRGLPGSDSVGHRAEPMLWQVAAASAVWQCRWREHVHRRPRRIRPRPGRPRLGAGGGHGRGRRSSSPTPGTCRWSPGTRRGAPVDPMAIEKVSDEFLDQAVADRARPPDRRSAAHRATRAGRSSTSPRRSGGDVTIVVGHGGSSKASLLLGSTAHYVIHHTEPPVVVVRGELRVPVRTVVVGVDQGDDDDEPDDRSIAALRWALRLPGRRAGRGVPRRLRARRRRRAGARAGPRVRRGDGRRRRPRCAHAIDAATDGTGVPPNGAAIVPVVAAGTAPSP